jgi:8-oxo-dGTP pyrophosphatase MutT (NUDIX family)
MIIYKGFLTLARTGRKEVVKKQNAAAVLLVDRVNCVVLLVKQRREAMIRKSNRSGEIIEALAGTRDEKIGVRKLIVKEVWEEVGVRIAKKQVKLLNGGVPLASSPGFTTERIWLTFAELDLSDCIRDSSRVYGLADHDERITRRVVTFDELETMVFHDMKAFALVQWFLREQNKKEGR